MENQSPTLTLLTQTDNSFSLNFSNSTGIMADLSGKLYLTLKKNIDDLDSSAVLQVPLTFTTDDNGDATLTITNEQLNINDGNYWYDFAVILSGKVTRSYPGKAEITQSVSQVVS